MSKTYLITLTPTGKFFFGGDMTFTVNGKETEYGIYQLYHPFQQVSSADFSVGNVAFLDFTKR